MIKTILKMQSNVGINLSNLIQMIQMAIILKVELFNILAEILVE